MEPTEFRPRFQSNVARTPELVGRADLVSSLAEFIALDANVLKRFGVSAPDADFLQASGLPRQAPPFLFFTAYSESELRDMYDVHDMPRDLFPLGSNGSGDPFGIELSSRNVVYFNHDDRMRRVFVNSTVAHFAEVLCMYQESLINRAANLLLPRLSVVDAACTLPGTMWSVEIALDIRENEG